MKKPSMTLDEGQSPPDKQSGPVSPVATFQCYCKGDNQPHEIRGNYAPSVMRCLHCKREITPSVKYPEGYNF